MIGFLVTKKRYIDSSRATKMYIDDKLEKINKSVDKNYNELNERIIELEENMKNRYNQVPTIIIIQSSLLSNNKF